MVIPDFSLQLRPLGPLRTYRSEYSSQALPHPTRFVDNGHTCVGRTPQSTHKLPCNRESRELVARFNSAYTTDAMKPYWSWYRTEGRQDEFNFHFHPHRRRLSREYEHSTLANVHAVSSAVMVHAVGPAEQKWQGYLKPPRVPSLDGMIHIRTQVPSCGLANHIDHARAPQAGDRLWELGSCMHLIGVIRYIARTTSRLK
jgi:hypothetical protein